MIIKTINVNKTMETIKEIALIFLGVKKYREYIFTNKSDNQSIKNYSKRNIRVNTEI